MKSSMILSETDRWAIEREYCSRSLSPFIKRSWQYVEPGREYIHNWHIDAISEHLEAAARWEIPRLYIAIPPGLMKSLQVGVFFPAWLWTTNPDRRMIATSYAERLTVRDSARTLTLLESPWYQNLWGDKFTLTTTSTSKIANTATGFRESMPFGSLTGSRGDFVLIDDPQSLEDAESDAARTRVEKTFLEQVPSRVNDMKRSSFIIIQQRLHQSDVIGLCEAKELGYTGLVLPMEFDPTTKCHTSIGWEDPRKEEGELLFPERFPQEEIDRLKRSLGSYAWSAQYQQRPSPRGGGLFKEEWLQIVDEMPPANMVLDRVRRWDISSSEAKHNKRDWCAGVRMSSTRDGLFYIENVVRFRGSPRVVEDRVRAVAEADNQLFPNMKVRFPQDPGAGGKIAASYLIRALAGYNVGARVESGSKDRRAEPLAAQAEGGSVRLVRGSWNQAFIDEVTTFPYANFDDQVDAAAGAFANLALKPRGSTAVKGRTTGVRKRNS